MVKEDDYFSNYDNYSRKRDNKIIDLAKQYRWLLYKFESAEELEDKNKAKGQLNHWEFTHHEYFKEVKELLKIE